MGELPLGPIRGIGVSVQLLWSKPEIVGIPGGKVESPGGFRDSGTPLVGHWSQIRGSFLPCCKEFQEVTKVIEKVSVGNDMDDSCGQVGEDGFQ